MSENLPVCSTSLLMPVEFMSADRSAHVMDAVRTVDLWYYFGVFLESDGTISQQCYSHT